MEVMIGLPKTGHGNARLLFGHQSDLTSFVQLLKDVEESL